jgi:hypothetical protein
MGASPEMFKTEQTHSERSAGACGVP